MLQYLNFWGRKGSSSSLSGVVAKRRMPRGRLENWGLGDTVGTLKACTAVYAQQRPSFSLVSSSPSLVIPDDSKPEGACSGLVSLANAGPPAGEATLSQPEAPKPVADAGELGSPSRGQQVESLAFHEWALGGTVTGSASPVPSPSQLEQGAQVFAQAGRGADADSSSLSVSKGFTNIKANEAVQSATATATAAPSSSQKSETERDDSNKENAATEPPRPSQSFFGFFLSAFQSGATTAKTEKTSDEAAPDAPAPAKPSVVMGQRSPGLDNGSSSSSFVLSRPANESVLFAAPDGTARGQLKGSALNVNLSNVRPPGGHLVPRRFRKTRDMGARRHSRRRESRAALSKGADRFLGLLRRVGMMSGEPEAEAVRSANHSSGEDTSDASREKRSGPEEPVSSVPTGSGNDNGENAVKCHTEQPEAQAEKFSEKPAAAQPAASGESLDPPYVIAEGDAHQREFEGGAAEPAASEASPGANELVNATPSAAQGDTADTNLQSTHFFSMLECPTAPTANPSPWNSHQLGVETQGAGPTEPQSCTVAPAGDLEQPVSVSAANFSLPEGCLQEQHCGESEHEKPNASATRCTDNSTLSRAADFLSKGAAKLSDVDNGVSGGEGAAESDVCAQPVVEAPAVSETQIQKAVDDDRGWFSVYRRLMDGIAQLVEDTGIRRVTKDSTPPEALPDAPQQLSPSQSPVCPDDRGETEVGKLEGTEESQPSGEGRGSSVNIVDSARGGERSPAPQSSQLWNTRIKASSQSVNCEARDPSSVAASYLAAGGMHADLFARAQMAPTNNTAAEMYAPVGQTPRGPSQRLLRTPKDKHPAGAASAPQLPFPGSHPPGQFAGRQQHTARIFHGDASAAGSYASVKARPIIGTAEGFHFRTFAEGLEPDRRRQQAPLQHRLLNHERTFYGARGQGLPLGEPPMAQTLHGYFRDPAFQQPVFVSGYPPQWVVARQYAPGIPPVLGLEGGGLATFIPGSIRAAGGYGGGQHVPMPVGWNEGAMPTVRPCHVANAPPSIQEVFFGRNAHEHQL